ncbi:Methionyl-tRNA formyltransferase [Nocardioides aquaticus]|uniref:Methionyl-tRNA formyltransferase n=2 Tax=Nocardioides aquaticus TaxID=160826 RepID=A0ABX8EJ13_9ACTN|nr:methionyl-tRNA formyltransferase [Nocardioides aquaticus]QVT80336.1 Methionyl-tRNA formyltransferase [Nocardioides aquaticus]
MRVVLAGTPEVALPTLEALVASSHDVVGVVTRPDAPAGRGRRLVASPLGRAAEELGLPVLKPAHPRDPGFAEELAALEPDCCPVVAYGALLPESVLGIPRHGWVNLHFSCLPAWRGAAPVQHALLAGDEVTGATTFRIVKALDAGPTFGVMTERVRPRDTAGDLLARLAEGGAGLMVATLDGLEDGSIDAREQPVEGVTVAPKIEVAHAEVDWTDPAVGIDRLVRACTPAPGAWTTWDGERLKLEPVELERDVEIQGAALLGGPPAPGELVVGRRDVHVGTARGTLRLGRVKPVGKGWMAAADWARGARPGPGARLGGPIGEAPSAAAGDARG